MKRTNLKRIFLFLLSFIFASLAYADPAVNSAASALSSDKIAKNEEISKISNDTDFIYYSLNLSGLNSEQIEIYMQQYNIIAEKLSEHLKESGISSKSEYAIGEEILTFLYSGGILKQYSENYTELNLLFDKGIYNCVSSSVLYYALALRERLDVTAIRTTDHAFIAVLIDGKIVDVETTTKYGFDPGNKKEFITSFGQTGFAYVPPSNYRNRTEISQTELLSLILSNRIAEYQRKGNFNDTVALAIERHSILYTESSYEDMINEFKNHAAVLGEKGDYRNAVTFLSKAGKIYDYPKIVTDSAGKLFYNGIVRYLEKNDFSGAKSFYNQFESDQVIDSLMKEDAFYLINSKEVYTTIQKTAFSQSRDLIISSYNKKMIDEPEKREFLVYIYSREIQKLSNQGFWQNALDLAASARVETQNDARLLKIEENVKYNTGVSYHNLFAQHYNRGDKDQAQRVLKEGLELVPGNKTLLSDLEFLKK